MTRPLALALLLLLPAVTFAGPVYEIVPSSATPNVNGIVFSPTGGDLIVTDTVLSGPTAPAYLDFGVGYDRTDVAGNVFFRPRTDVYQQYVLDRRLAPFTLPASDVVARGIFVGESEAFALGDGVYDYRAALLGSFVPGDTSPLDTPATLDLRFDTRLELGHQVLGGTLSFGEPVPSGAVPEPAAAVLVALGLAAAWMLRPRNHPDLIRPGGQPCLLVTTSNASGDSSDASGGSAC